MTPRLHVGSRFTGLGVPSRLLVIGPGFTRGYFSEANLRDRGAGCLVTTSWK